MILFRDYESARRFQLSADSVRVLVKFAGGFGLVNIETYFRLKAMGHKGNRSAV